MNNPAVKNKVHNYFVVEVFNTETKETKSYTQSNLITDYGIQSSATSLSGLDALSNIEVGESTIAPDPTVRSMPSRILNKATTTHTTEFTNAPVPTASITKKIIIQTNEYNGRTFRQLGFTNFSRAQIKDAEGNPISILKTDTDVVTIYGTVIMTIDPAASSVFHYMSYVSNPFHRNHLLGGDTSTSVITNVGSTAQSLGRDTANRKVTSFKNYLTTQSNGDIYDLTVFGSFLLEFPNQYYTAPLITGHTIANTQPTCNAARTTYALPNHQDITQLRVYVNGVEKTTGFNITQLPGYRALRGRAPIKNVTASYAYSSYQSDTYTIPDNVNSWVVSGDYLLMGKTGTSSAYCIIRLSTNTLIYSGTLPASFQGVRARQERPGQFLVLYYDDYKNPYAIKHIAVNGDDVTTLQSVHGHKWVDTRGWYCAYANPYVKTVYIYRINDDGTRTGVAASYRIGVHPTDPSIHYTFHTGTPGTIKKYVSNVLEWTRNATVAAMPTWMYPQLVLMDDSGYSYGGVDYAYDAATNTYIEGGHITDPLNAEGTVNGVHAFYNGASSRVYVSPAFNSGVPSIALLTPYTRPVPASIPVVTISSLAKHIIFGTVHREENFHNFITFDTPLLETDVLTIDYLPKHIVKTDQNTLDLGFELVYDRG